MVMRTSLLPIAILVPLLTNAQRDLLLEPANNARGFFPIDLENGGSVYAIDRNYGFDSSLMVIARADAAMSFQQVSAYRLHLPYGLLYGFKPFGDGFLVGGINDGFINYPFLLKTDASDEVAWYQGLTGLGYSQDRITALFASGTSFGAYTIDGGSYRDGIYRINGDAAVGITTGVEISTIASTKFRVYTGVDTGEPGVQIMAGSGFMNNASTTKDVMLMKVGPTGAFWMRFYDMNSISPQLEDGLGMIALADGNFLVVGTYTSPGSSDAFAMKVDDQGSVIWARRYNTTDQTLGFSSALELGDGTILVAGTGESYSGLLVLLAADGTPIWRRRYNAGGVSGTFGLFGLRAAFPSGYWLQTRDRRLYLNSSLEGCDFSELPDLPSASYVPSVDSSPVNSSPYSPTTQTFQQSDRQHQPAWSTLCQASAAAEQDDAATWMAFPDPTDGLLYLNGTGARNGMPVTVRDASGRECLRTRYHGMLNLSGLAAGTYILDLPENGARIRVNKQ